MAVSVLGACHRSPFLPFLASMAGTALLQTEILADCNVPEDHAAVVGIRQ